MIYLEKLFIATIKQTTRDIKIIYMHDGIVVLKLIAIPIPTICETNFIDLDLQAIFGEGNLYARAIGCATLRP